VAESRIHYSICLTIGISFHVAFAVRMLVRRNHATRFHQPDVLEPLFPINKKAPSPAVSIPLGKTSWSSHPIAPLSWTCGRKLQTSKSNHCCLVNGCPCLSYPHYCDHVIPFKPADSWTHYSLRCGPFRSQNLAKHPGLVRLIVKMLTACYTLDASHSNFNIRSR
jgi:hypothetical protein